MAPGALRFEPSAWRALVREVGLAYPSEACGVCLAHATEPDAIVRVRSLTNVAEDPRRAFAFDDLEHLRLLREADAQGERVRAFFHSHPDGEPVLSAADLEGALVSGVPLWPGVDWIVVATRAAAVHDARRFTFVKGRALVAPVEIGSRSAR